MAGSIMSTFMMFLPKYTQWFCLIGLCIFVFGIYIPYEERKKKKKQIKKSTPKKSAPPVSQKRVSTGIPEDKKQLEQLETLKKAGLLTDEEYQERKLKLK